MTLQSGFIGLKSDISATESSYKGSYVAVHERNWLKPKSTVLLPGFYGHIYVDSRRRERGNDTLYDDFVCRSEWGGH